MNERDAKLVQYLSEAYGKERELETSLQAHAAMTTRPTYRKRLKQHLKETKAHAKALERRIKKLGGGGQLTQTAVGKAMAAAKGPMHAVRSGSPQEKMLKNAKTEYFNEHEEIATYLAIRDAGGEGRRPARRPRWRREFRREEERMARFLEGQIKVLTGAVVSEEVPSAQRQRDGAARRRGGARRGAGTRKRAGRAKSAAKARRARGASR